MENTRKYALHIMNYVYISSVVTTCKAIILRPIFGQKKDRRPQENQTNQKKQSRGLGFWENQKTSKKTTKNKTKKK